ncbi:MAG: UUP1 family membrane protein [Gammaproteobacteria bacterium]|nr:UUP1 family membrane protein [Gammaproteobacteria bacterium]NND59696.1 UUP1 family membrane protein [Gammaproteobacteria bacterium]
MSTRLHTGLLALALTVIGLALFAYKLHLGIPLSEDDASDVWTVEARVTFTPRPDRSVKATLQLPDRMPGYAILNENFVSRGYGLNTQRNGGREAVWAIRRARGPQALYYRVAVYPDETDRDETAPAFPPRPDLEEPYATALQELVAEVRQQSADIDSFAGEMLRRLNDNSPDQYVDLFLDDVRTENDKLRTAQNLLAGARIPSRIVHGIYIVDDNREATVVPWLEVWTGQEWSYYDPDTGEKFVPDNYLVWWRGDKPLLDVPDASDEQVVFAVRKNLIDSIEVAERRASLRESHVLEFSLFGLPVRTQTVYTVLLLVPVGAFIMVLLRNVVGIRTFGTFTPVLIALAFRETRLLSGVLLFTIVVALGLAIRFYLEKLRLLMVPRQASVLIVVVLLLAAISIISGRLGIETGLSVALFPMVILTMVIERMSVVWEERGASNAIVEGIGSLIVAIVAYLVMSMDSVAYLTFAFPELLLVLLAATLLLGRYTGYRLTELARFNALSGGK